MLFAIGDVHGHFDKLSALLGHCRAFAEAEGVANPDFVLLGDYIDRGPKSREVIEFLAAKPKGVRAICGNHEDMMIAALAGGDHLANWLANGGGDTLVSYGVERILEIPRNHLNLIAALPTSIDDGLRLFVHAGIDPEAPDERDRHILLWTRKHPPDDQPLPRFVIHGHTPVRTGRPDLRPNRLNLDTGAGWGRHLSAAAFHRERAHPTAFLDHVGTLQRLPAPVRD